MRFLPLALRASGPISHPARLYLSRSQWCPHHFHFILPTPHRRCQTAATGGEAIVFYRWPTIKHFRLLSRFKLYQVSLMALFLPPATLSYQQGALSGGTLLAAWTAAGGTLAVLLSLSHLFTRVVGEMAYLPASGSVRLSTLTFMGGRRDLVVPPEHLLPQEGGGRLLQRLELVGSQQLLLYSLRYGCVLDHKLMTQFLLVR